MVEEVLDRILGMPAQIYESIITAFSSGGAIINIFVVVVGIVIVSLFIWEFYKSLSKRNLIKLNLKDYNTSAHPIGSKFIAIVLYLIEYIIAMPLIIILWFAALSIVLMLISERAPGQVLLISAAMVGAIRVLAYHREEISKDLAKMFPFIVLSVFLLSPQALDFGSVLGKLSEIPLLLGDILSFILVVVLMEVILRVLYTIYDFYKSEDERIEIEKEADEYDSYERKKAR
jgi:hypothetical protein